MAGNRIKSENYFLGYKMQLAEKREEYP